MIRYILKRLVLMIPTILLTSLLIFWAMSLTGGDPVMSMLPENATFEQQEALREELGLNDPFFVQYFRYIGGMVTGDMGTSYVTKLDVFQTFMGRLPMTLTLGGTALIISVIISIPLGIWTALNQNTWKDTLGTVFALFGVSMPNFWLGLMLILYFSINLGILPATYQVGNNLTLIMPAIVLGTGMSASVARMTRSSMLEVKNSDYILTARAKGLPENKVVLKHILGNAMIPIVTTIGAQFGGMLGGSSVTEKVFNINGIGSYIVEKQYIPDIPVVLAGVVYISFIISIMNLVIDILYAVIDPRIKSRMKNY